MPARAESRPLTTLAPVDDMDELVQLREEGWTFPRLAGRYGLSDDAVCTRYLRAEGHATAPSRG